MDSMDYRELAAKSLARAKAEIDSGDRERLKYAALELRMTLESLTYSRAVLYKKFLSKAQYDLWQPKKLMQALIQLDPFADKDRSVTINIGNHENSNNNKSTDLGREYVLSMDSLKNHYDALGSYLHMPLIRHLEDEYRKNLDKLKERCSKISGFCETVLSSNFSFIFAQQTSFLCKCNETVFACCPPNDVERVIECSNCGIRYTISNSGENEFQIRIQGTTINCAGENCSASTIVPSIYIKAGTFWKCDHCGGQNKIIYCLEYERDID